MEAFVKAEVAKMGQIDAINARKAKAQAQAKTAAVEAAEKAATAKAEAEAQEKKAPSLMNMDVHKLKQSQRYRIRMKDDDDLEGNDISDNELAMPSVSKEGKVTMFTEEKEKSERQLAMEDMLNGDEDFRSHRKKKGAELDSFGASLLGENIAPPKPQKKTKHVHLSRLLEPRSTRIRSRPHHASKEKQSVQQVHKMQAQQAEKKKEAKKMNALRMKISGFVSLAHEHDPNRAPKPVPKPAKPKVVCKPPMCLPRGHTYEHAKKEQHGHKAIISVLEQAYASKPKKKKPKSIWDQDDAFMPSSRVQEDAVIASSSLPTIRMSRKPNKNKKVKKFVPSTLEDLVETLAPGDEQEEQPQVVAKPKKMAAPKPWETDHFAQRMQNTWHTKNALREMKSALTDAEHDSELEADYKTETPKLNRQERIASKVGILNKDLQQQSVGSIKRQFNRDFLKRQAAAKEAAKFRLAKKLRLQSQRAKIVKAKEEMASHAASDAVATAFSNVFDEAWQAKGATMGMHIPHGP